MDLGPIIIQVTAIIGGLAATVAILNGVYELREKRRKSRAASTAAENAAPAPHPVPSEPPAAETHPPVLPSRPLTNLPVHATSLIGRKDELADVEGLLLHRGARLVTLTGPAGIGKTRLALQVGADLLDHYADGVLLVKLAAVNDSKLVVPTIGQTLDVREQGERPLLERLKDYLREKRMLLVLDNFEHVVDAAPAIAELLAAAPELQVLVTSREVLRLYAERSYAIPPLALPRLTETPQGSDRVAALSQYEAVQLFVERAQAASADFALTGENAADIAEICYRLDGLPLAIELAAARVRLLSPHALRERLTAATGGPSLGLLTGGARDFPARQQTLRDTIAWSYDLLQSSEQDLFRRLGVFSGGWTLEAAEAVCGGPDAPNILDGLESLVGKSLVQHGSGSDARFTMLQTIREYALERLDETQLGAAVRNAHAAWCLVLADQAVPLVYRFGQQSWFDRLETEHGNMRAALRWALDSGQAELAVRLAGGLAWFWQLRDRVSEGRGWLEEALAAGSPEPTQARARALLGFAELVSNQGDWAAVWPAMEESISIARAVGDRPLLARGLAAMSLFKVRGAAKDAADSQAIADEGLAIARSLDDPWTLGYVLTVLDVRMLLLGDVKHGSGLSEEALASFEKAGDQWGIDLTLRHLGMGAIARGDYGAARGYAERGVAASQALGDRVGQAYTINALGDITRLQGDNDAAAAYYAESLKLYRELGLTADIPACLHNLGYLDLARGDIVSARQLQTQSLELHREVGNRAGMVEALTGLAAVERVAGAPERAAKLFGAVEALRSSLGAPLWPAERAEYDRQVAALDAQLDETTLAKAWEAGRAMTLEQAAGIALEAAPVDAV